MGKILLGMVAALIAVGACVVAYLMGLATASTVRLRAEMRKLGFTHETAKLFVRARKILVRLADINDLDGQAAEDYLSPETRQVITTWISDYRREVSGS